MTMISRKDFTSSDYRLFMLPAFTRAFLFKSSPLGELSYNIKKPTTSIEVAGSIILINPERMALRIRDEHV